MKTPIRTDLGSSCGHRLDDNTGERLRGHKTQLLFLRARRIESGVLERSGTKQHWRVLAGMDICDAASGFPSLAQLLETLETLAALPQPGAPARPGPVRVLVADAWLPSVTMPWSAALLRSRSAQAHARAALLAAGFDLSAADPIRMDAAALGAPRLVFAYPQILLSALQQWAQRAGLQITSVLPLVLAAWALLPRQSGAGARALALCDGSSVSIAHGFVGASWGACQLAGLSVRADNTPAQAQALTQGWQRLCLRQAELAGVSSVALLDLSDTGNAAAGPPFVTIGPAAAAIAASIDAASDGHALAVRGRRARWTLWQSGLVAALAIACIALLALTASALSKTHALRARIAQIERSSRPAVQPIKRWSREEIVRVQSVNRALAALNLPIDALLDALVPPRDIRVALLAFETVGQAPNGPAQSAVKLLAQACSAADMARYVAFVAARRPFQRAYLTRHEMIAGEAANCPYRFAVEAQWSESTP